MSITIRDIAKKARVSISTVSYVINDGPRSISEPIRSRVRLVMDELGYEPSAIAQSLAIGSTHMIGVIIPSATGPFSSGVLRGILSVLRGRQYAALVYDSSEERDLESAHLVDLHRRRVDGIIIVPSRLNQSRQDYLTQVSEPVVVLNRAAIQGAGDIVTIDHAAAVFDATTLLLQAGHRSIGFLVGPAGNEEINGRAESYRNAYSSAGLVAPEHLLRWLPFDEQASMSVTREFLSLPDPPSAIFAGSTRLSIGALRAIIAAGLSIPQDVAFVAYGELPWAELAICPLTVVEQRVEELGQMAARLLLNRIADDALPAQQLVLKPRLVARASHRLPA
jgi:LacI family transcriptional regulator